MAVYAGSSFYLARTYHILQNYSAALTEFHRRVRLGGWHEEVYESKCGIAMEMQALKYNWSDVLLAYLECYQFAPTRAEPLYAIAHYYFRQNSYPLCSLYVRQALTIPFPQQVRLWVQDDVYSWRLHYLQGMICHELKCYESGVRSLLTILHNNIRHRHLNQSIIQQQLLRYHLSMNRTVYHQIECEVAPQVCPNNPSSSSSSPLSPSAAAAAKIYELAALMQPTITPAIRRNERTGASDAHADAEPPVLSSIPATHQPATVDIVSSSAAAPALDASEPAARQEQTEKEKPTVGSGHEATSTQPTAAKIHPQPPVIIASEQFTTHRPSDRPYASESQLILYILYAIVGVLICSNIVFICLLYIRQSRPQPPFPAKLPKAIKQK